MQFFRHNEFDDQEFTVIRDPMPDYDSRVFGTENHKTCYRAYSLQLCKRSDDLSESAYRRSLYIVVKHGRGVEVCPLGAFYDGGAACDALLSLPDRKFYGVLFMLYRTAKEAADNAAKTTARTWAQAYTDKRIRKKRGRNRVYIETPFEQQIRLKKNA